MNESGQGRLWGRDKKGKVREAKHQTINSCRALPREGRLGRGGIWQRRRLACLTAQSRGSVPSGEVVIKRGWPAEGGGVPCFRRGAFPPPPHPPASILQPSQASYSFCPHPPYGFLPNPSCVWLSGPSEVHSVAFLCGHSLVTPLWPACSLKEGAGGWAGAAV